MVVEHPACFSRGILPRGKKGREEEKKKKDFRQLYLAPEEPFVKLKKH